jgi:hypothetical protein
MIWPRLLARKVRARNGKVKRLGLQNEKGSSFLDLQPCHQLVCHGRVKSEHTNALRLMNAFEDAALHALLGQSPPGTNQPGRNETSERLAHAEALHRSSVYESMLKLLSLGPRQVLQTSSLSTGRGVSLDRPDNPPKQ